jgi:hypothetical protein
MGDCARLRFVERVHRSPGLLAKNERSMIPLRVLLDEKIAAAAFSRG